MLEELKDSKEHGEANGEAAELPEGSSPLEAREDATENAEETSEEASGESATSETPVREEKSIIIGGKNLNPKPKHSPTPSNSQTNEIKPNSTLKEFVTLLRNSLDPLNSKRNLKTISTKSSTQIQKKPSKK